jgi:hypothetical protein
LQSIASWAGVGGPQSRWHSIGDSWNPRRALLGQLCWAVAAGVTLECPGARLHGPADPHGERSHVERRPGDERAHALSRKSACSGRETRTGAAGVRSSTSGKRSHYRSWRCKTRNPRSAGDPGKRKPFLTPTRRLHPAGGKFPSGRDEPGTDEAVLNAIVFPATRPPTTATARRKRRSRSRGRGGHRGLLRLDWGDLRQRAEGRLCFSCSRRMSSAHVDAQAPLRERQLVPLDHPDSAAATARPARQTGGRDNSIATHRRANEYRISRYG